jgi:hypothetical protein
LQLRKTNLHNVSFDSLDLVGLIMMPALLNTRSLAAELAGAVNNFLAKGRRPEKRASLNTPNPQLAMAASAVNKSYCTAASAAVGALAGVCCFMKSKNFAFLET